jgi:TctA family transporter
VLVRFFRLALLPLHFMLLMGSFLEENFNRAFLISRNNYMQLFEGMAINTPFNLLFLAVVAVFIGAVWLRKQIVSGRLV